MATRLNVVMSQSPPAKSAAQSLAEQVVGELIGVAEIDLTLVQSVIGLRPDSTDCMNLQSISTDIAVLDWAPAQEIAEALSENQIPGSRSPHPHDSETDRTENERRFYLFDLTKFDSGPELIRALQNLKNERQTRTFSLGGLTPQSSQPEPKRKNAETAPDTSMPTSAQEESGSSNPLDLDHLVDLLDEMDP